MEMILSVLLACVTFVTVIIVIGKVINGVKYKIRSKTGIQKAEYITIGGIEQYIQIRGQDSSNPAMIVLHGGPVWKAKLKLHRKSVKCLNQSWLIKH